MRMDRHTKADLTVIAAALVWLGVKDVVPDASAQGWTECYIVGGKLDGINGTVEVRMEGGFIEIE